MGYLLALGPNLALRNFYVSRRSIFYKILFFCGIYNNIWGIYYLEGINEISGLLIVNTPEMQVD